MNVLRIASTAPACRGAQHPCVRVDALLPPCSSVLSQTRCPSPCLLASTLLFPQRPAHVSRCPACRRASPRCPPLNATRRSCWAGSSPGHPCTSRVSKGTGGGGRARQTGGGLCLLRARHSPPHEATVHAPNRSRSLALLVCRQTHFGGRTRKSWWRTTASCCACCSSCWRRRATPPPWPSAAWTSRSLSATCRTVRARGRAAACIAHSHGPCPLPRPVRLPFVPAFALVPTSGPPSLPQAAAS